MRTYSFTLAGARLAYLLTITRADESVIRVTSWGGRAIPIDSDTWEPDPGLEVGDYTITNNGEIPNLTFKVSMNDDGPFIREDIENGLFDRAEAILYITDARTPSLDDIEVIGSRKGEVRFDPMGKAQFELLNSLNLVRDVAGRKYQIEDDVDFGDPRRNKIPTFPTVDETSDDLQDVGRVEAIINGERRRFRYAAAGNPSDYHNVYWEADGTGTTGASAPVAPSDTPGATITDGGVTWIVRNAYARAFQVASIIDENHITITVTEPRAVDDDWFAPGFIWMCSGYMKGFQSDVDAYDQGTNQISLVMPFGNKLQVGDWGEITPGYDQTLDMAVDKYGSALTSNSTIYSADGGANNYRGFPHITGTRFFTSQFIPGVSVDSAADADDPGAGEGGGGGGGEGGGYEAFWVEFESGSD
jgi:hypothetical protein